MAYTLTSAEALINREVQDVIEIIGNWGWTTTNSTINADYDRLQVLKNDINARLTGSKRDYAIATIDAIWSARKAWKASGTATARDKTINALERIQAVLASQPDVVVKNVAAITDPVANPNPPPLPAPIKPPPNVTSPLPGTPGAVVPKTNKILGLPKWAVYAGGGVVAILVGRWAIRKFIKK